MIIELAEVIEFGGYSCILAYEFGVVSGDPVLYHMCSVCE